MTKKIIAVVLAAIFLAGCATTHTSYFRLDRSLQADIRTFGGFEYVPLTRLCDVYSISCKWDTVARTATVQRDSNIIVLREGSERILVNGTERSLDRPVMVSGAVVYVPLSFVRNNIAPMITTRPTIPTSVRVPEATVPSARKFTIRTVVLDTGHGGKDVGAVGRGLKLQEKDVALALSKRIKQILENSGIKVIMTRSDDTFIPLPKRADMANSSSADIFVSIHVNASRSRLLRGFECYYLSDATDDNARALAAFEDSSLKLSDSAEAEHSKHLDKTLWDMTLSENRMESGELASYICSSVEESLLLKNRGVRSARFYVLKNTNIPSVLVEAGYISNRADELKLKDPRFLDQLAEAIARGILRYKERYERTEGFTKI
ncbi:MAG: N-acetylmuramoyl-L-alanine amidase [Candidatus Omnitrophica bacterium]|nr:N-acetylmuramoyl-L-alanine amidase [Candidatus Omnitrophota bacterium]MCM8791136.1 N-acetylmuramoyl-L-alanine amidase [Candidatus Omnitrophota bacterium]